MTPTARLILRKCEMTSEPVRCVYEVGSRTLNIAPDARVVETELCNRPIREREGRWEHVTEDGSCAVCGMLQSEHHGHDDCGGGDECMFLDCGEFTVVEPGHPAVTPEAVRSGRD